MQNTGSICTFLHVHVLRCDVSTCTCTVYNALVHVHMHTHVCMYSVCLFVHVCCEIFNPTVCGTHVFVKGRGQMEVNLSPWNSCSLKECSEGRPCPVTFVTMFVQLATNHHQVFNKQNKKAQTSRECGPLHAVSN